MGVKIRKAEGGSRKSEGFRKAEVGSREMRKSPVGSGKRGEKAGGETRVHFHLPLSAFPLSLQAAIPGI